MVCNLKHPTEPFVEINYLLKLNPTLKIDFKVWLKIFFIYSNDKVCTKKNLHHSESNPIYLNFRNIYYSNYLEIEQLINFKIIKSWISETQADSRTNPYTKTLRKYGYQSTNRHYQKGSVYFFSLKFNDIIPNRHIGT